MTMLPFKGRCHTCGHDHDEEDVRLRDLLDICMRHEDEWRAMVYAPLDGTPVVLLIRHSTWWAAHKLASKDEGIWQASCEGHWIDHNGGGWTWRGMAGTPIGWRPLSKPN
jgi:hypothetical protein